MNVEIGTEAAQFLFWEYINSNFFAVRLWLTSTHIEPKFFHKAGRTVNNDKYYADIANSTVKFDEKGDGLARYTIFNYQKKLEGAGYDYKVT